MLQMLKKSTTRCLPHPLTWRSLQLWESHGTYYQPIPWSDICSCVSANFVCLAHFHHNSVYSSHLPALGQKISCEEQCNLFGLCLRSQQIQILILNCLQVLHFWPVTGLFVCSCLGHPGQRPSLPRLCTQYARTVILKYMNATKDKTNKKTLSEDFVCNMPARSSSPITKPRNNNTQNDPHVKK